MLHLAKFNSGKTCSLCDGNTTTMPWRDNRRNAAWMDHIWTTASWLARNPGPACPLFALPFMSILCVCYDWMHCAHIGVYQYVFGSILFLLCFFLLPGTAEQNMKTVMAELRQYWKLNPTPGHFQTIGLTMFVRKDRFPKLKGRAGEVKQLSKALLHVFNLDRGGHPLAKDSI